MSEERTQYNVHPDVLVRLETSEKHIKQLENTLNGYAMIQGRHAAMIAERDARIAELEATVQRLEQDNRRLRHLDSMPVDALRRYYRGTVYTPAAAQRYDYMPDDYDVDSAEIYHWLFPKNGDA